MCGLRQPVMPQHVVVQHLLTAEAVDLHENVHLVLLATIQAHPRKGEHLGTNQLRRVPWVAPRLVNGIMKPGTVFLVWHISGGGNNQASELKLKW